MTLSKMGIALAAALISASPGSCSSTTTHPFQGKGNGCLQAVHIEAVKFASESPRVRVRVVQDCTNAGVIATQLTGIELDYRESRFTGTWLHVGGEKFTDLPGRSHAFVYIRRQCWDGRYRARVSMAGTFDNGQEFRAADEQMASVDCEDAVDVAG